MGSKVIFHLEAFVAKFMKIYERYVADFTLSSNLTHIQAVMRWAWTSELEDHGVLAKERSITCYCTQFPCIFQGLTLPTSQEAFAMTRHFCSMT